MATEPAIRPYRTEDLAGVLQVLKAALGETPILQRSPELWAWKHETNPFGPSLVMVAESVGRIAGVRALMRWDLALPDGTVLRCLRAVDTATHPDFERRGIFRKLTTAAVEQAKEDGFDLIFNTPNDRSGAGYLTMGWRVVGAIGVMVRPLSRRGAPVTAGAIPDPDLFFSPPLPPFEAADIDPRPGIGLRTPRTQQYLAWRFEAHPYARYQMARHVQGMAVLRANLRRARKEVVVSDLLDGAGPSTVRMVAKQARAAYLAAWFSVGSPERRAALRGGMLPVPRSRVLTLVANPLRELPVDVFQLSNWDLAISDLELL